MGMYVNPGNAGFAGIVSDEYAPYVGFAETEVEVLADRHGMDMADLRRWYDGCELRYVDTETHEPCVVHAYAPFFVMSAIQRRRVGSYWTSSEAFSSLRTYVDLDFDGLQQAILQALGGADVRVDTHSFENSIHDVANRDDALTWSICRKEGTRRRCSWLSSSGTDRRGCHRTGPRSRLPSRASWLRRPDPSGGRYLRAEVQASCLPHRGGVGVATIVSLDGRSLFRFGFQTSGLRLGVGQYIKTYINTDAYNGVAPNHLLCSL